MARPPRKSTAAQRRPGGWLLVTGVGLVLAFAAITWVQIRQVALLSGTVRYEDDNIVWAFFQLESEFLQLRDLLREAQMEPEDTVRAPVAERVRERFEIFASRIPLVTPQRIAHLADFGRPHEVTIASLQAFVKRHERTLGAEALQPLARAEVLTGLADLSTLFAPVHELSLQSNQVIAEQVGRRNDAVRDQTRLSLGLTAFQTLLTLAFAALTLRQIRVADRRGAELEQVARTLREARAEAEAASTAKSAFLANMSHELRTPFNGMLGMLSLVDTRRLDPEQADYLRTARDSANHLLDLLNDILDISKLESGRLEIAPHPLDLHRLLRDVHALMALSAEAKGLALQVQLAPDLPQWVMADGKRLKQILFNLMSNAVKFTDTGEVALLVSTRPAPADALGAEPSHELRFVVRDTGIGISEAVRTRLFQRFSQGDASTSRRFGGTGLGLEISRSLARMMGGDITCDSVAGQGSVFTLSLDLPGARAPALEAADGAAAPAGTGAWPHAAAGDGSGSLDLLVADDHPVNRKYMAALLRRMGHQVRMAADGAEAVAMATEQVPDLIFMDVHMPVQDGLQATRALRAGPPALARVPIVALTADVFADTRRRVVAAGMNNFLSKPVQGDDIERVLVTFFGPRALAAATPAEPDAEADAGPAPGPELLDDPEPGGDGGPADSPVATAVRPRQRGSAMPIVLPAAATAGAPAAAASTAPRRRFRASDVAEHLDMAVIGQVCVGVGLAGYRSVLNGFLDDEGGSARHLLAVLDRGEAAALNRPAHAVKGAAASLGLKAIQTLALTIETDGAGYSLAETQAAATLLRELMDTARALLLRMGFA